MSFVLFMVFGILEIYALFGLMFKMFRLPYFEYLKEISIIAFTVAFVSYLIRVYFEINQLADIVTHLILYILFFRYLIKVKVWRALVISFVYIGYGVLNVLVYLCLKSYNIVTDRLVSDPNSVDAYILQAVTIVLAALIAWIIYSLNLGFSFIIKPPHDFFIKTKMEKKDIAILTSVMVLFAMLMLTFYLIFHFASFISIPLIVVSYIVLVYLAYRRDMSI